MVFTATVISFIVGNFTSAMPSNVQFGHAGAIIEGEKGTPGHKKKILKESGAYVVENFDSLAETVKLAIKEWQN